MSTLDVVEAELNRIEAEARVLAGRVFHEIGANDFVKLFGLFHSLVALMKHDVPPVTTMLEGVAAEVAEAAKEPVIPPGDLPQTP